MQITIGSWIIPVEEQKNKVSMKIKELIKLLEKEDPDRIVIMASDAEGNSYSPLSSVWTAAYKAENTWSGEVGLEILTEEDIKRGYSEEDVLKGKKAIVFSPTN